MGGGPYAEAFRLVTMGSRVGELPVREFARAVADVAEIESFLEGERLSGSAAGASQ